MQTLITNVVGKNSTIRTINERGSMTREELAESIIDSLERIAADVDAYDYGLPAYGGPMEEMKNAIINWVAMYESEKQAQK